jgi:hypothetical protein
MVEASAADLEIGVWAVLGAAEAGEVTEADGVTEVGVVAAEETGGTETGAVVVVEVVEIGGTETGAEADGMIDGVEDVVDVVEVGMIDGVMAVEVEIGGTETGEVDMATVGVVVVSADEVT